MAGRPVIYAKRIVAALAEANVWLAADEIRQKIEQSIRQHVTESLFIEWLTKRTPKQQKALDREAEALNLRFEDGTGAFLDKYRVTPREGGEKRDKDTKNSGLATLAAINLNLLLEGVPGSGKTHAFNEIREGLKITSDDDWLILNCHPSTQYEDVVEGLRPFCQITTSWADLEPNRTPDLSKTAKNGDPTWHVVDGVFLRACVRARMNPTQNVAILLDELNRANVPKILGDLMTVMERSKRHDYGDESAKRKVSVTLPLSGAEFAVPSNLIVVATMNSVDHSTAQLDQALLRRFWRLRVEPLKWAAVKGKIADDYSPALSESLDDIGKKYNILNEKLEERLGPDGKIGQSYLFDMAAIAKSRPGAKVAAIATAVWRYSVAPQILESIRAAGFDGRWEKNGDLADLREALKACGLVFEEGGHGQAKALRLATGA